jgi:hypothetical protein
LPLYWVISAIIILGFLLYIRTVKRTLPEEFLENSGYNSLLGTYRLLDDDVAEP